MNSTPRYLRPRRRTREVAVGQFVIGGDNPIRVQSMTSTETSDVEATVAQIRALWEAGCEIVRLTVNTRKAAAALPEIRKRCAGIPLVADIHYNHHLALEAAPYVDKIRINPGNIGSEENVRAVIERANEFGLPIRVGVNQGSLERDIALKYGAHVKDNILMPPEEGYPAEALVESALRNVEILESYGFTRTILSVKSSNVPLMVEAYRQLSAQCDYPLHLGVTEAGTKDNSNIKSSIGIGALLLDGIGDTLRVSIAARRTEEKIEEVRTGFKILQALGLRQFGVEVVACPTCGREDQGFDTTRIAREIEERCADIATPVKVSVMGCYVNGPGEAAEADLGVVASGTAARIYRRGELISSQVPFAEVTDRMVQLIRELAEEKSTR
ncbi:MAG: flavodoxin-dependent (E)-4-hydroxy-3-methylbut-2-enyl-diphosphate synthase [Candidatus Hydrogenedentota bacterium]|nr:flavodoxin-dependent (E)-4-hydroxy-3-methylbut-2-enyl-diphosphate synthase [Candidatus Sumerlaea chitinivorans]RMH25025.1 MAG: flavodoxin-dependent (E)-4-hydroxy-3-methylbut-2-enyl-diphosphate synthase [Candidatus Hydrogenedentota bacterium]GIX44732.1 MAG: 4-hydroxy-3-methylbut-2-en-1-yl diphosphate synthase (flavodoxin) [Candidatus Sumerlaea sp.]